MKNRHNINFNFTTIMKRVLFSVILLLAAGFTFAQEKTVKEAKSIANEVKPNFNKAEQLINQALTNPETKDNADTWDVAGFIQKRINEEEMKDAFLRKPYDTLKVYNSALNMCKYYLKCDELAQVPNEKGKIKNKYRKANAAAIIAERPNLINGGIQYYNLEKNKEALDFFGTYIEIAQNPMFEKENPNITVKGTYDSSGKLQTQIEEGIEADVFMSAATKQMNALTEQGLVEKDSVVDLLQNQIVLITAADSTLDLQNFEDITKANVIAIGDPESVPVGQYSTEILTNLGILDSLEAEGKITYGSNVKEVTTQVSEAAVDAGIIYATDAFSAGLTVVDQAEGDLCKQVIYPAAVLNISRNPEAAKEFLAYLQTDTCMQVFEAVGFTAAE